MKFKQIHHRVGRAEALVEGRRQQTAAHVDALAKHWKQAWTPWRIVGAGLGLGFLSGHSRPSRAMGVTKWIRVISTLSGAFTSLQTTLAAWQADQATNTPDGSPPPAEDETGHAASNAESATQSRVDRSAEPAKHEPTTARAAATATAASNGHTSAQRVSSYGRSAEGRGETEHWAAHPPRPAEAATDVSER